MSIQIQIPTPLRRFVDDHSEVRISAHRASTVDRALEALVAAHPALHPHLYTDGGKLKSFVNLFLNDKDVRNLGQHETALNDGDSLTIVPSIAGGSVAGREARAADTSSPATPLPALDAAEIRRYSRHLILPEIGMEGQRKLKQARVLIVGTGGLGSPTSMYLAAAGVGTLGLVDFDRVDESNLHRQLLFGHEDVGQPKTKAAKQRLHQVNPHTIVELHDCALDSSNALDLVAQYDLVVDGTDNFPTRYLVNDACVLEGKANVYGSIFRFEGQVSVFWGAEGPCYRCLFAEPPPPGLVPSCAEGGVLGVLPGIIGCLQANEAIKLIVGAGVPMLGRLLLFDALKMSFRELKLRKNPDCPICSEHPTLTELIDYHQFCGLPAPGSEEDTSELDVSVVDAHAWLQAGEAKLLDVRTAEEREIATIAGAVHIPVGDLEQRLGELDSGARWVVHCHHGPRSTRATKLLREHGINQAFNLSGGIDQWSLEVDPETPRY